jgi:hypothetical protein
MDDEREHGERYGAAPVNKIPVKHNLLSTVLEKLRFANHASTQNSITPGV